MTEDFLLVDLVNNLEGLAEDQQEVLRNVAARVETMDKKKLERSVSQYGNVKTKRMFQPMLEKVQMGHHAG